MNNAAKKILIIGASGLIGGAVVKEVGLKFPWKGTSFRRLNKDYLQCNIMNSRNLEEVFKEVKPTNVINCSQLAGGVDFCEQNTDLAEEFHFDATANIGKLCKEYNARLVFLSSECVFDGRKESYTEDDTTNPLSVYGKLKLASEEWISANLSDYLIIRTMSVFGWDPLTATPNAVMKVYFSHKNKEKCFIPVSRWGTPTYVRDLAKAIVESSLTQESGIFHVAGLSFINRFDWLKKVSDGLGWDSSLLVANSGITSDDSKRPLKIGLDTRKFRSNFKTQLHTLEEAIELLKNDVLNSEHSKTGFINE